MIIMRSVAKQFQHNKVIVTALQSISLQIHEGEFISIMGRSGSGKTTLLNVLGGMTKPTSGEYFFCNKQVNRFSFDDLCEFRKQNVGYIVQKFALVPALTIYQNIALPLEIRGYTRGEVAEKVEDLAEKLNLSDKLSSYPVELSGGQCQKAAIARAIISAPRLILADEPTGSLDIKSGIMVMELLSQINNLGATIVLVTHDNDIASYSNRILQLVDGRFNQ